MLDEKDVTIISKVMNEVLAEGLKPINSKLSKIDERLTSVETRLTSVETRLSSVEEKLIFITTEVADIKAKLETLEARNDEETRAFGSDIVVLRKRIDDLESQVKDLQAA